MREELSASERRALGLAMRHYLQAEGANLSYNKRLCEPVGDGVYEFKLRYNLKDLTSRLKLPFKPTGPEDTQDVMLRVFFHQYGDKIVLLLHGYDKGAAPGRKHQQAQIQLAKDRKTSWLARKAEENKQAAGACTSQRKRRSRRARRGSDEDHPLGPLDSLCLLGHNEPREEQL